MTQDNNKPRFSQLELAKKLAKQNNTPQRSVSKTSGYSSSTSKAASNSSFWMDADVTEELTSGSENKAERFVKLAAYQRAIANFVKIVTQRGDINIKYSSGEDSYTDDKTVIISSALNEKEFDVTVGLALHEASHCALTDFKFLRSAVGYNSKFERDNTNWWANNCYPVMGNNYNIMNEIKYLFNVIEDRRIDKFIYDQAPGYQGYYKAMYNKYFNSKAVDKALENGLLNNAENFEDYKFHITNFTNPRRNLKVLPGIQDVWDLIDIKNISRFKNSQEVFDCAVKVWQTIQSHRLEVIRKRKEEEERLRQEEEARKAQEQQEKFTNGEVDKNEPAQEEEEEDTTPSNTPAKGEKEEAPEVEEEEKEEQDSFGQSPTGTNEKEPEEDFDENDNEDMPEQKKVPITEQTEEDEDGEEGEDGGQSKSKGNPEADAEEEYGPDSEYEYDDEESMGSGSEAESDGSKAEGNMETDSEVVGEQTDTEDSDGKGTSGAGAGEGNSASSDEEAEGNSNWDDPNEMSTEERQAKEDLMEELRKELEKAIEKQDEFMEGEVDKRKLNKNDAKKVNAAAQNDTEFRQVGGDFDDANGDKVHLDKTNVLVVKGLSTDLIASGFLGSQAQNPEYYKKMIGKYGYTDYITEGIILGKLLGQKLQTRDEDRSTKNTRLENGRIDRRLIAELGFGNGRIFAKEIHSTVTPAMIHITLDASGSMSGKKWAAAMKTAIAIAQAASMISSMEVVISVRGTVSADYRNGRNQASPMIWVIYDSRKMKLNAVRDRLYAPQASGATPEGLCFEAIQKELINDAKGKDMYLINISDGAPMFDNYRGSVAYKHTNKQIKIMKQNNINVLSFFVAESEQEAMYSKSAFNAMYEKDAQYIDVANLTQLAKSLNTLFTRKSW